jgi:hypothetical protein
MVLLFICIIINKNKMKNLIKFILSLFKVNKKLPTKTYTIKSRNPDVE